MYYLLLNEQQHGPYTAEQVREWLRQNPAMGGTHCWAEGCPEWRPLADTDEFRGVPVDALMSEPEPPPLKRWDIEKKCWVGETKSAGGVSSSLPKAPGKQCPQCKSPLGHADVLCVKCGYKKDLNSHKKPMSYEKRLRRRRFIQIVFIAVACAAAYRYLFAPAQ